MSLTKLKNNFRLCLVPLPTSTVCTVMFIVNAGSVNETHNNNGVSHFFEHLLFRETENIPDVSQKLDNLGLIYDANTSVNFTEYNISGKSDLLDKMLFILSEIITNPIISTKNIEKVRNVIINEINGYSDNDEYKLDLLIKSQLYNKHPLAFPIGGKINRIERIDKNDIIKFKQKYYVPDNCLLVISGNFCKDTGKLLTEKYFKKFMNIPNTYIQKIHYVDIRVGPNITTIKKTDNALSQTRIILIFRTTSLYDEDSYILHIISNILSAGRDSRLYTKLRNNLGITYRNESVHNEYEQTGHFKITLYVDNKFIHEALNILVKEIKKLKKTQVTKKELNNVINQLENSLLIDSQNTKETALYTGLNVLYYKKIIKHKELLNKYKKITEKDIMKISNKYFTRENVEYVMLGETINEKELVKIFNSI